jgi:tryptophan-rich hypothetical protein
MYRLNPRKLLGSKWTARRPQDRERHFIVVDWLLDDQGVVLEVELEAVLTRRVQRLPWQALKDQQVWLQGWQ